MRKPDDRKRGVRRSAPVAFGLALGFSTLLGACSEKPTEPNASPAEAPAAPVPPLAGSHIAVVAGMLDDATSMFVVAVADPSNQVALRNTIKSVGSSILRGEYAKAREDMASGRLILSSLSALELVDVNAVGVAFDFVETALAAAGH